MKYTDKLMWALVVSLTLLLAGCGGSSSTPMAMTELEKLQKRAMDAAAMAKTQSDAAKASSDAAQEAAMGLVDMQTGNQAEMHADAAKKAYEAALAAYNMAKMKSDEAKAATDIVVAAQAAGDAEAEKTKAETQAAAAKRAADAAAAATGGLSYDSEKMTYMVGDKSVLLGPMNNSTATVDGKSQTTRSGKQYDYHWSAAQVESKRAASSDEVPKPQIDTRTHGKSTAATTPTGPIILSVYGNSVNHVGQQIHLAHKYIGAKAVNGFIDAASGTSDHKTASDITTAQPYGKVTDSSKKYSLVKATGDFYHLVRKKSETTSNAPDQGTLGSDKTARYRIATGTKKNDNIFYYEVDGTKKWLRHVSTEGTTVKYKPISVVENVEGFSVGMPYQHINFGLWSMTKKKDGQEDETIVDDMIRGIGFVRILEDGQKTMDMPTAGTATYNGHHILWRRSPHAQGNGKVNTSISTATVTANFESSGVTVALGGLATLEGKINGADFSGAKVVSTSATWLTATTDGTGYTGKFNGSFFGDMAAEVGGVYEITSEERKKGEAYGAFGGAKQ